jgi:hypothetical protein
MSGWTQDREQYHRRLNALLLLMLSGAIRPANAELPKFRESMMQGPASEAGPGSEASVEPNTLSQPEPSIWFRNLKHFSLSTLVGHCRCYPNKA